MIKLEVRGAEKGYDAAEWCRDNLQDDDWDMWMAPHSWSVYQFEFKRPQDATMFGLRWLEQT